ncbi:MAG: hypothetical protein K1X28_00640 [Parachlamydiales bacterium]|nr:hypothetical protein [Parachlamydiales bacterium]
MSGLSIQLNRFGAGASSLNPSQIYPPHKQSTEDSLRKIFDRHVGVAPSKEFPLRLQFKPGNPSLKAGNQEIPLPKSRELKRVGRIVQYYQNTGHLPRASLHPNEEAARMRESKKSVQSINEASMPGNNGNILAGMRLADDTLSLTRNVMYALPAFGPNDSIANHLGYYAGIFWTFFAFRELDDGIRERKRSKEIGDSEGLRRAHSRLLSGGIVSAGSLAYLAGKVNDTFQLTNVSTALLNASNLLFGAGSLLAMGTSILGAVRCDRFNKRLGEYLDNPGITEKERMQGAIRFLKDSISITPEEKESIARQIEKEHPNWTIELKEQLLSQKLANLTEVKVRYLKRRTSNKSLRLILEQSDQILKKLNDSKLVLEGIRDATFLINTVQKESKIKMTLYILGFIAAVLSFVAMVVGAITTAAVLPFVLYGIAGTIYLGITIYSIGGMLVGPKDDPKIDANPMQNISHLAPS